jgi:hypothetical protein
MIRRIDMSSVKAMIDTEATRANGNRPKAKQSSKPTSGRRTGKEMNGSGREMLSPARAAATARTTAVVPDTLNQNWEIYALQEGVSKNEVLIEALKEYLIARGYDVERIPKIELSW